MNLKKFYKTANRGLLLGGIILVGLVISLIVKRSEFEKEKPVIEKNIKDYVKEFVAATEVGEKDTDLNGIVKEENKEEIKNKVFDLINKYWDNQKNSEENWNITKNTMMESLESFYETENMSCNIYDQIYNVKVNSIQKSGKKYAIVSANIEINGSIQGYTKYFTPFSNLKQEMVPLTQYTSQERFEVQSEQSINKNKLPLYKDMIMNASFYYRDIMITLVKKEKQWKIIKVEGFTSGDFMPESGFEEPDSSIENKKGGF